MPQPTMPKRSSKRNPFEHYALQVVSPIGDNNICKWCPGWWLIDVEPEADTVGMAIQGFHQTPVCTAATFYLTRNAAEKAWETKGYPTVRVQLVSFNLTHATLLPVTR
jgi:hypothetical protein